MHHISVWCCSWRKSDSEIILWSFSLCLFAKSCFYIEVIGWHCYSFSMCHVLYCVKWGKVGETTSPGNHSRNPRWEAGEVRHSSPCPCCLSGGWFLSQIALKILYFSPGFPEKVGWCGGGKRGRISPSIEERAGSTQSLAAKSWWILPGRDLNISVSIKSKLDF